jgi:hypothetical protein
MKPAYAVKCGVFFLVVFAAIYAAACSGSGSTPVPPPPTGGFSNADLNGQYAFLMQGTDSATFSTLGRVGSFTADGKGNIMTGMEDVNSAGTGGVTTPISPLTGTYSIQADGRGTISIFDTTTPPNQPLVFSVTLLSPSQGYIVETDGIATASGTFDLQNSADFTQASVSGPYVFDASGIDSVGNADSIIGQLQINGAGGVVSGGDLDENDGTILSGEQAVSNGVLQLNAATGGPASGRGLVSFSAGGATFDYVFYIVDTTRIRMVEATPGNPPPLTLGDAVAQTNAPASNAAFAGSFVFLMGGASAFGADTRAGRVTSNGDATLATSIALDDNNNGTSSRVPSSSGALSSMTYSIDPSGSGRGTMTFHDSKFGTFDFVFYMSSPNQGVIQDDSAGFVADGTISSQTAAPFTNSNMAGKFGFNLSGISFNSKNQTSGEEDFVGQLALSSSSSNNVTGAADFSEFSSNQGVFLNIVVNGSGLGIQGDGTTSTGPSNTLQLKFNTSLPSTLNFAAYIVNPNTIFLSGTDGSRVTAGSLSIQSK